MLCSLPFGEIYKIYRFQPTNQSCSRHHLNPASKPPHSPSAPLRLCASSPHPEPQCLQLCPHGLFGRPQARGRAKTELGLHERSPWLDEEDGKGGGKG